MTQKQMVADWNRKYPPGTPVNYYKLIKLHPSHRGPPMKSKTTSGAWLLGGHSAVVNLEGVSGCYSLEAVFPIT